MARAGARRGRPRAAVGQRDPRGGADGRAAQGAVDRALGRDAGLRRPSAGRARADRGPPHARAAARRRDARRAGRPARGPDPRGRPRAQRDADRGREARCADACASASRGRSSTASSGARATSRCIATTGDEAGRSRDADGRCGSARERASRSTSGPWRRSRVCAVVGSSHAALLPDRRPGDDDAARRDHLRAPPRARSVDRRDGAERRAFDFLFVPPFYTFNVSDARYS